MMPGVSPEEVGATMIMTVRVSFQSIALNYKYQFQGRLNGPLLGLWFVEPPVGSVHLS